MAGKTHCRGTADGCQYPTVGKYVETRKCTALVQSVNCCRPSFWPNTSTAGSCHWAVGIAVH